LPALQEIGLDDAMISVQPKAVGNAWIFAIQDFLGCCRDSQATLVEIKSLVNVRNEPGY
jgi:hypothetical protein